MSRRDAHLNQWRHNRAFLATIEPNYPDWVVTVTFYTALQAVDALLMHDKVERITSHDSRNDVLIRTQRYQQVWRCYRPLHDLSRTVRYLARPEVWVPWSALTGDVLTRYLYPLERTIERLMKMDLGLAPIVLKS